MLRLIFAWLICLAVPVSLTAQEGVESRLIRTGPDEQMLVQTLIVEADIESTWAMFTQADQIARWMAPAAIVDLREGGAIRTNYDPCAVVNEAEDSITLNIVNFVPNEMLTLRSSLENQRHADWMNDAVWERRDTLSSVISFVNLGDGRTQITALGLGYGTSEEWDTIIGFFIAGNEWTYGNLHRAIAGETVFPRGCSAMRVTEVQ